MPAPIQPSGNIGALLRIIQQERKKAPHQIPPTAEPSAPIREAVSAPLESPIAPESRGTARIVAQRPEAAPTGATGRGITPGRASIGPIGGSGFGPEPPPAPAVSPEGAPALLRP